jgi:hypothetical protein
MLMAAASSNSGAIVFCLFGLCMSPILAIFGYMCVERKSIGFVCLAILFGLATTPMCFLGLVTLYSFPYYGRREWDEPRLSFIKTCGWGRVVGYSFLFLPFMLLFFVAPKVVETLIYWAAR